VKLLILGGTGFLGPHVVDEALRRGHSMTLFNRGRTNPHLFPDLEKLRGDRDGNLEALRGRRWDGVIDTSGYVPRIVRDSATLLADSVRLYLFISTISVYADFKKAGIDEDYPVGTLDDPTVEKVDGETYGPLKALCEQAAEQTMPGRVANVRPGLIVGPRDTTDRFTYWPVRVDRGGEVLAPGNPEAAVQFIDARDLAAFAVKLIEDGHTGVYNATGPDHRLTFQELLHGCKVVSGSDASFTWIEEKFLIDKGVAPWTELPLWLPGDEYAGLREVSVARAVARGLRFRPAGKTIEETIDWHATRPADHQWRAGITAERETELLAAWRDRKKEKPATSEPATAPAAG
jgi:2'-hydroxyisoflavone reductase